jgi:signal transduction histidine kinase
MERQSGDHARDRDSGDALAAGTGSSEGLHAVLASIADGVLIVDVSGTIRFANPAAEHLLGSAGGGLTGRDFGFPLVHGERTELDLFRPGKPTIVAEMRVVATEWHGRPAFCASLRDVTERKQAEEQRLMLVEAQAARRQAEEAVRARDEFLSVAAHELKTPITRLRLAVQLAARQLKLRPDMDPAEIQRRLEQLDGETGKLARLVTQLLDVSRIERGQLPLDRQAVDLAELARGVVAGYQLGSTHHEVELHTPETLTATVDPLRLEQVLTNLLDNAVKYSPEGGKIMVEVTDGNPTIATLAVRDWGVGIPVEHREGIFKRFYQAHAGTHMAGLGVGLYVARQIVNLHGGTIEAEFPDDGGTRFVVTLPR